MWWRRVWSLHNGGMPVMRFTAFCGASFQRFASFWSCNNLCLIRSQRAKSTNLTSMTHPHWQVRVGTRDPTGLVEEARSSVLSIWFDPESWGTLQLISQQFIRNCLENRFLTEINLSVCPIKADAHMDFSISRKGTMDWLGSDCEKWSPA